MNNSIRIKQIVDHITKEPLYPITHALGVGYSDKDGNCITVLEALDNLKNTFEVLSEYYLTLGYDSNQAFPGNEGKLLKDLFDSLIVDDNLSSISINPVQNKVVTLAIEQLRSYFTNIYTKELTDSLLNNKLDTLQDSVNIKTINNNSILGSGNIELEANGIEDITVNESALSGGSNTVTITKNDGTTTTFNVRNGRDGANGVRLGDVEIADNLETNDGTKVLSAKLGYNLKGMIYDIKTLEKWESEDLGENYWLLSGGIGATVGPKGTSGGENWSCLDRITIKEGDTFEISTRGGDNARAYALTDTLNVIYEVAAEQLDTINNPAVTVTALQDGYLYVNCKLSESSSFVVYKTINFSSEITELNDRINTVSELSNDVEAINNVIFEEKEYDIGSEEIVTDHNWILNGGIGATVSQTPQEFNDWSCIRIAVSAGDKIDISTIGGNTARAWALTDISRGILAVADATLNLQTIIDYSVNVTENGYLYVNCSSLGYSSFSIVKHINIVDLRFEAIEEDVTDLDERVANLELGEGTKVLIKEWDLNELEDDHFWLLSSGAAYAEVRTESTEWACIMDPIPVKKGDIFEISTMGGNNARAWGWVTLRTSNTYNIVDRAEESANLILNPATITAPMDGYLLINCKESSKSDFYVKKYQMQHSFENLEERIITLEDEVGNLNAIAPKYKNNPLPLWKDSLKILAIGNSFTDDATKWIRTLEDAGLTTLQKNNHCLYQVILSSTSLLDWYYNITNNDDYNMTRVAGNLTMGTETIPSSGNPYITGNIRTLLTKDWDVVVIQLYSYSASNYATFTPYLNRIVSYIRRYCTNPKVAIAYLSVWSDKSRYNGAGYSIDGWKNICNTTKEMINKDGIDIIIPTGTAIQNARNTLLTTLDELTRDGHHLDLGIGRYIAACTWYLTLIAPIFGVNVIGNTADVNPSGGIAVNSLNRTLCLECAFAATINMWEVTSLIEESQINEPIEPIA